MPVEADKLSTAGPGGPLCLRRLTRSRRPSADTACFAKEALAMVASSMHMAAFLSFRSLFFANRKLHSPEFYTAMLVTNPTQPFVPAVSLLRCCCNLRNELLAALWTWSSISDHRHQRSEQRQIPVRRLSLLTTSGMVAPQGKFRRAVGCQSSTNL